LPQRHGASGYGKTCGCACVCARLWCPGRCLYEARVRFTKELFTLLDLCVSSLRRGHANLLCIVPILTDDPRRESELRPQIRNRIVHARHLHTNQITRRLCNLMADAPPSRLHGGNVGPAPAAGMAGRPYVQRLRGRMAKAPPSASIDVTSASDH
jgi:hypothetical protein